MNINFFGAIAVTTAIVGISIPASAATLTPVDLELSLLVDVSGSVSSQDYALQIGGYKQAFTNLSSKFGTGGFGAVAVNFIEWSGAGQQRQSIPWTLLNSQASAIQFANTIGTLAGDYGGGNTAPGSAINFAVPLFSTNEYDGQRWVIDVSGDGPENSGVSTSQARNNALAAGVDTINGVAISAGNSTLKSWYEQNIQGGTGSFVIAANGFEDFGRAIEQKLGRELAIPPVGTDPTLPVDNTPTPPSEAVPEPTTMLGIALAGSGLAYFKRRKASV